MKKGGNEMEVGLTYIYTFVKHKVRRYVGSEF